MRLKASKFALGLKTGLHALAVQPFHVQRAEWRFGKRA
jgi:hypothetical protein